MVNRDGGGGGGHDVGHKGAREIRLGLAEQTANQPTNDAAGSYCTRTVLYSTVDQRPSSIPFHIIKTLPFIYSIDSTPGIVHTVSRN